MAGLSGSERPPSLGNWRSEKRVAAGEAAAAGWRSEKQVAAGEAAAAGAAGGRAAVLKGACAKLPYPKP